MTNEEWIRHAVEQLDSTVFGGDLDLLNHPFQISWGRCQGKKLSECIQPYDGEDVNLNDFFPTTITVSYTISDPIDLLGNLTMECIRGFFNEKGCSKRFKKLAEKLIHHSRFPQILHNNLHFLFQKRVAVLVVPYSCQFGHEGFIPSHPAIECLEGSGTFAVRTV